jgi:nucleotide-binding universal stress UspA family protein
LIPPRTILAPTDFSDASRASLHCAARLASLWNARLHVLHVLDPLLVAAARTRHIDLAGDAREELATFVNAAVPGDGLAPSLHVAVGAAAAGICDAADAHSADLVVIGSRGLSGLNRLMMGTTAEHVIRRAHTSVLTVSGRCPGDGVPGWGPVIAALDNPAVPGSVATAASILATSLGAPWHVVHVVPPLPALTRWRETADEAAQLLVDDARRQLAAALSAHGGATPDNVHVTSGPVADALAAEVGRYTGTLPLLVLGRAAPGQGAAPGSVASRVIARATAAVWVFLPKG